MPASTPFLTLLWPWHPLPFSRELFSLSINQAGKLLRSEYSLLGALPSSRTLLIAIEM